MIRYIVLLGSAFSYGSSLVSYSMISDWTTKPGPKGPESWAEKYPMCGDNSLWQTPINIPLETTPVCLDPIQFTNLDCPQVNVTLQNAWRSACLFLDPEHKISISGGPLPRGVTYYLALLTLNVGSTNSGGSAHQIRGKAYPAELSLGFYDIPDANETNSDLANSMVVLTFLVEISPDDNPAWDSLVRSFPRIMRAGSSTTLNITSLHSLLPQYQDWTARYFTYVGSMKIPPCREHTIRVVYATTINLSSRQINAFRQACDEDGEPIVNNIRRPLKRSNHNQILRSFDSFTY